MELPIHKLVRGPVGAFSEHVDDDVQHPLLRLSGEASAFGHSGLRLS